MFESYSTKSQNNSLARKTASAAARSTLYVLFSSYTIFAANFLGTILLTRLLTPQDFGIWALVLFYTTTISVLRDWGLESALFYTKENLQRIASTYFVFELIVSGVVVLLAASIVYLFKNSLDLTTIYISLFLTLTITIETLGVIPKTLIEKSIDFKSLSLLEAGITVFALICAVLAAYYGFGVWALVLHRFVLLSGKTLTYWYYAGFRPLLTFDMVLMKTTIRKFGLPVFVWSLANNFLLQFDNFLIGTFVGTITLGYYTRAYSLATLPTQLISNVIIRVASPLFSIYREDLQLLQKTYRILIKAVFLCSLLIALLLFLEAESIILFLIGDQWLPSVPFLKLLVVYSVCRILIDFVGPIFFTGLAQPVIITKIFSLQSILLVGIGYIFTLKFQAFGTIIAVSLVMLIGVVLGYVSLRRTLRFNLFEVLIKPLSVAVIILVVYPLVSRLLYVDHLLFRLVVNSTAITALYVCLVLLLERDLINEIKNVIHIVRQK